MLQPGSHRWNQDAYRKTERSNEGHTAGGNCCLFVAENM